MSTLILLLNKRDVSPGGAGNALLTETGLGLLMEDSSGVLLTE